MGADPNISPSPRPALQAIEGSTGTQSASGQGLIHQLLDPSINSLRRGRIEDIYMDACCAVVSVYAYRRNVPCLLLESALNRFTGTKDLNPPTVLTEVLVWLSNDHKFGIAIGCTNAPSDGNPRPTTSLFNTPVDRTSKNEVHQSEEWGMDGFLVQSGNGIPTDVLPGDSVRVNEMGAYQALLKFVSVMRGDEGSKLEQFMLDEVSRITGFNLQIRTAMGERNVMNDFGLIEDEESGSPFLPEALGGNPTDVKEGRETLMRRFHNFRGYMGAFIQNWTIRPNVAGGDLDRAAKNPDMGMSQDLTTHSGWGVFRSTVGGGIHKSLQIAVPKRAHEVDDPAGNNSLPRLKAKQSFEFSKTPGTPAAAVCQLRDYFAWQYNMALPQRFLEKEKDWVVPDEANCPAPLGAQNLSRAPGVGSFHCEFFPENSAMSGHESGEFADDRNLDGFKARAGEAWDMLLPDGSKSVRDTWGSGIEMRGGHIDITAIKDIRLFAGGSVVIMGGDDVIVKAHNCFDITSSKGQGRIKAQSELYLHSEEGGMLISLGGTGRQYSRKKEGEDRVLPGISIKVPNQGGFTVQAGQANFNLANRFFLQREKAGGPAPQFITRTSAHLHWIEEGGGQYTKFGNNYIIHQDGNIWSSGRLQLEGDIYVKGGACVFGGAPTFPGDWSKIPTLKSLMSGTFQDKEWQEWQWPFSLEDLQDLAFVFRRTKDYATLDGKWFETFWQREFSDLGKWEEEPAKDGSYPYPGKEHYKSMREFWTYTEQNVKPGGRPVERSSQKNAGGIFVGKNWQHLPVHPNR